MGTQRLLSSGTGFGSFTVRLSSSIGENGHSVKAKGLRSSAKRWRDDDESGVGRIAVMNADRYNRFGVSRSTPAFSEASRAQEIGEKGAGKRPWIDIDGFWLCRG